MTERESLELFPPCTTRSRPISLTRSQSTKARIVLWEGRTVASYRVGTLVELGCRAFYVRAAGDIDLITEVK